MSTSSRLIRANDSEVDSLSSCSRVSASNDNIDDSWSSSARVGSFKCGNRVVRIDGAADTAPDMDVDGLRRSALVSKVIDAVSLHSDV